jgi:predicted RNA-binding Zn ribbon-like protein
MARDWDLEAGRLPLNFTNTAEWHRSDQPSEMLENYSDLVAWSEDAHLLNKAEAKELLAHAERKPAQAAKALKKAVEIREVIYRIFTSITQDQPPDERDLKQFNQELGGGLSRAKIRSKASGFEWSWDKTEPAFDQMLWPILRETAELLVSPDIKRVGQCADDRGCGYLFYDTSRNHSRRWCSMEGCGNRAKALRHYQRKK